MYLSQRKGECLTTSTTGFIASPMDVQFPFLYPEKGRLSLQSASSERLIPQEAVLVGMFPKEEAPWPLSPTLFMNANLGHFSPEDLFLLALAEKTRLEENIFRSYYLDTRKPVAVISRKAQALDQFVNVYGGLLELRPLLLGKDAAYPVITDLEIQALPDKYRLTYLLWAPFDLERCRWCALCGRVCPPKALKPELFIDPVRCDFCRKCEETCPHQALDLSRYEQISEEFDYVLFLDDPPEGVPRLPGRFFLATEIEALLRQQGRFHVVESVRFQAGPCQYTPRLRVGCLRCVPNCPQEALSFSVEEARIDHFRCTDCGTCISLCPTGALQEARFDDRSFFSYFQGLNFLSFRNLVIGEEEALKRLWWERGGKYPQTFFLAHPSPTSLHPAQIIFPLALGLKKIVFLGEGPEKAVRWVNAFFKDLFGVTPVSQVHPLEFKEEMLEKEGALPQGFKDFSFPGRRKKFIQLLRFFWEKSPQTLHALEGDTFGHLEIEEDLCTLCLACLNVCHTGALTADAQNFALLTNPSLCIACGACVKVCPEGALQLKPGLPLKEESFSHRVLLQDEPLRCQRCGKTFGTKRSKQKVAHKLSQAGRFEDLLSLLDLCEDCRVQKLFEDLAQE